MAPAVLPRPLMDALVGALWQQGDEQATVQLEELLERE